MIDILSVENMRNSDAATIASGASGKQLMMRAAGGIYDVIHDELLTDGSAAAVHILCGSGNNAGDGYALALILEEHDIPCSLYLTCDRFSEDGKYYYDLCSNKGIRIIDMAESYNQGTISYESFRNLIYSGNERNDDYRCIIVDCLLGTGFKGTPREPLYEIIEAVNNIKKECPSNVCVVSADINSGLNGDNGLYEKCICSDITVSIGGVKPGLYLNSAKDVIGKLINTDIGIRPIDRTYKLFEVADAKMYIPERNNNSNKGTYGYIALVGGSYKYSGAISLAAMANAAMRSGAGVVLVATPQTVCPYVIPKILESTVYPLSDADGEVTFVRDEIDSLMKKVKVIAFGMGIGATDEVYRMLEYIISNYDGILIIDADGLNCLAKMPQDILLKSSCRSIVLTPHPKEFSRLSGKAVNEILSSPIDACEEYAKSTNTVVLLKGPTTVISNSHDTYLVNRGCAGMATAGSGDVLSGITAAVCGYNRNRECMAEVVATAAYINGLAGELAQEEYGSVCQIASDTVNYIPKAVQHILKEETVND